MKTLIAGSNGMVGSAVTRHLIQCGHQVSRVVRHTPGPAEVWWNPDAGEIDAAGLDGFDGVVHLAQMPWPMRWTDKAKQRIRANRLATNRLLAESLAGCEHKPEVLICASRMRYYAEFSPEERQNPPAVFNYSLPPPDEHINVWEDDFSKMHSPSWWERLFRESGLLQVESCCELEDAEVLYEDLVTYQIEQDLDPADVQVSIQQIEYGRLHHPAKTLFVLTTVRL